MNNARLLLQMFPKMFKDTICLNQIMDGAITDVISKLKFIGRIQKGEKINVRNMQVQADTMITRFSRTFFVIDNRTNAYNFIESIINRGFDIIHLTLSKSPVKNIDKRTISNLISDLRNSTAGISNMRDTYSDDIMFCCKLDALIESIKLKLDDIDESDKLQSDKVQSDDDPE